MKSKTADIFYAFCVSVGGICIALLYRVDILTIFFILTLSVSFSLFCCFLGERTASREWVKRVFAVGALISAAVSIYLGTRLVCDFSLDNSFVPICIFLSCVVAVSLATSTLRACKSVASVMSAVCVLFLLIILLLCILEGDFSKVYSGDSDRSIIFPLAVFSVIDIVFIMPYIRKSNRCMFVLGSALMPAYMLVTTVLAISTLSADIFYSLDTPVITMWQTCYVISFVDRFETLILCVLFAICTVKAGIFLKCVFDIFQKRFKTIVSVLLGALTIPLVLRPGLIYIYAFFSLIVAIIYCVNLLLKKCC